MKSLFKNKNYIGFIKHCAQMFLDKGANINHSYGYSKETVLHEAVREERVEWVEFLLSLGADWQLENAQGKTALMLAKDERCKEKLMQAISMCKRAQKEQGVSTRLSPKTEIEGAALRMG